MIDRYLFRGWSVEITGNALEGEGEKRDAKNDR